VTLFHQDHRHPKNTNKINGLAHFDDAGDEGDDENPTLTEDGDDFD
jgi:hypothetical protein